MNIPVKFWANNIENEAHKQIINLSNLPFAYHHVAIMPDCHSGYGMPIGGVLATERVVIPNAVGVDIGCGMCAVKTSLKVEQLNTETLKKIMGKIREVIPVGFNRQKEKQDESLMPKTKVYDLNIICNEYQSALKQLGTLGVGNHFIEIQKDTEHNIWIMIHSGSRNIGFRVANYYNKIAKELNQRWHTQVPKEWDLAFLPIDTQEAKDYILEMQYCVDFALANRKLMMDRIFDCIRNFFPNLNDKYTLGNRIINIAHNYAAWENHFGKNVIIHRKGATLAREGTIGIIPGSQGSKSYIVEGLGNPASFESCSHGAGRTMSRTKATKELNLQEEIKKLDDQGIIHGIRTEKDLDEATGAYKNIDEVMENQKDLVEIVTELSPMAVIKG
jgi:tRNA-splicing ligase RtcB